jgi:hypothetical protein
LENALAIVYEELDHQSCRQFLPKLKIKSVTAAISALLNNLDCAYLRSSITPATAGGLVKALRTCVGGYIFHSLSAAGAFYRALTICFA